jgi:GTP cyclohydrolase I
MDMRSHIKAIIDELVPDATREGLLETPARVEKYLSEMTSGYRCQDPIGLLKTFEDGATGVDQMVFQGCIPFHSMCEHHMAPFFGVAHIGYIPGARIVGLSKLHRLLDVFARRLQVQERLTNQVAETLMNGLEANGVGVCIRGRHMCMESRGTRAHGPMTYTTALRGSIKTDAMARAEFLQYVAMADVKPVVI